MKLASYIMPSFNRPQLLDEVIEKLRQSQCPIGWEYEVIVCCPYNQRRHIPGVVWTTSRETDIGSQMTGAFRASRGDLILVTGDDDFQSPYRLGKAIEAYEAGAPMTGLNQFLFYSRKTAKLALWEGPPGRAGAFRGYSRHVLDKCGAWPPGRSNVDHSLDVAMQTAGMDLTIEPLPEYVGDESVATDGEGNVSRNRPFPDPGVSVKFGSYKITGCGPGVLLSLPIDLRKRLDRVRGLG